MAQITLRLDDDLLDELDEEAEEREVSRSQYIRDTLESRDRADELEARVDDLRRQLQEANAGNRDVDEIVAYVEEEREVRRRREKRIQRREERRDAPAWRRAKWWLLGRD
jgi:predicted transcriptional regulator